MYTRWYDGIATCSLFHSKCIKTFSMDSNEIYGKIQASNLGLQKPMCIGPWTPVSMNFQWMSSYLPE